MDASIEELETVPGIGKAKAKHIYSHMEEHDLTKPIVHLSSFLLIPIIFLLRKNFMFLRVFFLLLRL